MTASAFDSGNTGHGTFYPLENLRITFVDCRSSTFDKNVAIKREVADRYYIGAVDTSRHCIGVRGVVKYSWQYRS
jgi:hypothetical protein